MHYNRTGTDISSNDTARHSVWLDGTGAEGIDGFNTRVAGRESVGWGSFDTNAKGQQLGRVASRCSLNQLARSLQLTDKGFFSLASGES